MGEAYAHRRASGTPMGDIKVGDRVLLREGGADVEFLVVHQGLPSSLYDASCDGTWVLRKDIHSYRMWDPDLAVYENSDIHSWLNDDYVSTLDSGIRDKIKSVKIPYLKGGGTGGTNQSGSSGLPCKIFLLSASEAGWTLGLLQDGDVLEYFKGTAETDPKRIAYLDGYADAWWLRSPEINSTTMVWYVNTVGYRLSGYAYNRYTGVRPALILPKTYRINPDLILTA